MNSKTSRPMKPIPVSAAQKIAEAYGYDQVIVIARRVGDAPEPFGEHCTTYGVDRAHCDVAARCGDFLKFKVMSWHNENVIAYTGGDASEKKS